MDVQQQAAQKVFDSICDTAREVRVNIVKVRGRPSVQLKCDLGLLPQVMAEGFIERDLHDPIVRDRAETSSAEIECSLNYIKM